MPQERMSQTWRVLENCTANEHQTTMEEAVQHEAPCAKNAKLRHVNYVLYASNPYPYTYV